MAAATACETAAVTLAFVDETADSRLAERGVPGEGCTRDVCIGVAPLALDRCPVARAAGKLEKPVATVGARGHLGVV